MLADLAEWKVIFRRAMDNGGRYILGQHADPQSGIPAIKNGTDVTGRGHPDIIVSPLLAEHIAACFTTCLN